MAQEKKKTWGRTYVFWAAVVFAGIAPLLIKLLLGGSIGTSWLAFFCGAFVAFMARFDDLAEFSLGPLKARMRETIDEANATLEQLRAVATSMAMATLTDLMAGNFQASMSVAKRLALHDSLMNQLRELGVPDEHRRQVDAEWRKGIYVTYHRIIGALVGKYGQATLPPAEYHKVAVDYNSMLNMDTWEAPRPDELEAFCKERGVLTPEISLWLADYRHYLDTGEIRRKDQFARA
jgi:hypothetical protein